MKLWEKKLFLFHIMEVIIFLQTMWVAVDLKYILNIRVHIHQVIGNYYIMGRDYARYYETACKNI